MEFSLDKVFSLLEKPDFKQLVLLIHSKQPGQY